MNFKNTDVYNIENAIRGMRLPMNSYNKSDSRYETVHTGKCDEGILIECKDFFIGDNDLDLMQRLIKAGNPHDKFMRQIFVSVDITAPLYWWKEMDQYKVGTTTNSQSTMHKLSTTPITMDCFETDDYDGTLKIFDNEPYKEDTYIDEIWEDDIYILETIRQRYLETKDKRYWKALIRRLPESWLQTRTWTANYEVLRNIVHQRKGHKLTEWEQFIDWAHTLPYAEELIILEDNNEG